MQTTTNKADKNTQDTTDTEQEFEGHEDRVVARYRAEQLAQMEIEHGCFALHAVAFHGTLGCVAGGVTAAQLAATVDTDYGGTAFRLAVVRGHTDQITGGVTVEQLRADPTTDLAFMMPSEWEDLGHSEQDSTMEILAQQIGAGCPSTTIDLTNAVQGKLPIRLIVAIRQTVGVVEELLSNATDPAERQRRAEHVKALVKLHNERCETWCKLVVSPEATAELL